MGAGTQRFCAKTVLVSSPKPFFLLFLFLTHESTGQG